MTTKRVIAYIFMFSFILLLFFLAQCLCFVMEYDGKTDLWFDFKHYNIMNWIFQVLYTTIAITGSHLVGLSGSDAIVNG